MVESIMYVSNVEETPTIVVYVAVVITLSNTTCLLAGPIIDIPVDCVCI